MSKVHMKREAQQQEYQKFIQFLVKENPIRIQPAIEVGKKTVHYFRGKEFFKWVEKQQETLRKQFPLCFLDTSEPLLNDDITKLGTNLLRFHLISRAEYEPLTTNLSCGAGDKQKEKEVLFLRKWPKRLIISSQQNFTESSFFIILYEPPTSWHYLMLTLIVTGVIVICMFPAWPLLLKLAAWYSSVVFITFTLSSVILRLITFLLLWFFGADFWIFPNLFDEDKGVIDSFRPLYEFHYRNDSWYMVTARVFLFFLSGASFYQLSQTHSLSDVQTFASRQFLDVLEWGHMKLAAPVTGEGLISRDTENVLDFTCLKLCGFHAYETLKEECFNDCSCVKELIDSPCFSKCKQGTQRIIEDAESAICQSVEEPVVIPDNKEL